MVTKEKVNSMLSYLGLSQGFWGEAMLTACYLLNRVPNKRNMITPYELCTKRKSNLNYLKVWGCNAVIRLLDLKLKNLGKRGIKCIFDGYAEHSKAFRFYVIEPNESVSVNSIIESRDAIFDENRFSSVPRPSQRSLLNGTGDIGGTRDEVFDQHSYCFNVEDDPKKFDEAMKSHDVDLTKEFLSSRFSIKDMGEANVILGIRIKHESNGIAIPQSHYIEKVLKKFNYFDWQVIQQVQKYLKKTMDYSLTYTGYSSVIEGYTNASWINNTKDNSSTNGWVFLLGRGTISWASKKQTCITSLIMDSEFMALAAAIKKAEWLKNLIIEIPLCSKPIAPISILCDKAPTLAKPYSQVYNGKSIHLGVSHSMIHELITNGVVSIEFVRSQQNLVDHLMKGLARDLVLKSAEGMGLKSNQVTE
ncbi:zinc finger, CCHC-type containing protein [Tanacetum coccineum]